MNWWIGGALLCCLLLHSDVSVATYVPLTVEEEDANPSAKQVKKLKVTNGTLTDNLNGTVTLDITGATAWDAIGDATADGSITLAGFETDFASTLDSAGKAIMTVTNSDADTAADTDFISLIHNDGADANVFYLRAVGDADGTPQTDYLFSQTAATIRPDLALTNDLTVTGGDITLGTTSIFSGGDTASLNNIDAIDATTETTLETAIDTLSNLTAASSLATVGTITSGVWNAGAVTSSGKITGNASLDVKNGATTAGVLALFEDSDDGTNKATFNVPALAADTAYILPPDDGDAGEQLQTNGSGTLTWEAAGTTAWNDIGDATADGSITLASFETDFASTLDSAGKAIMTVTNSDADTAADTDFISLIHNDGADANVFYLRAVGDADGTPQTDYLFSQTAATIRPDLALTNDLTVTGGDITLGTTSIFSGGDTASLNNIDAIDATTETTLETAIDTLSNLTAASSLATVGTITSGVWNAGAVTSSGKITGNASLDVKNGATTAGVLALFEDSDDGTNKATFNVPALAADTAYILPPDDGDAGEQLQTNGSGTLTWEAAGATAWNDIGDATADGSITLASFETDFASTLDSGGKAIMTVTNSDADTAADTDFISLIHNDGADANVFYLRAVGDADGTPQTDYLFSQTAATIRPDLALTNDLTVTGGDITLGTTSIFSGGDTASLNNIDAIDATTETTLETAIDTLSNLTAASSLATVGTITSGVWNAGAVTSSGKITGNASLDVKNGATTAGVLALFEDSDDGTNKATFNVPTLAADTAYILPPDDGDAGEQLQTNGSGTLTWEAAASIAADSLDFIDFSDSMTLDASTSIGFGAGALSLTFTNNGSANEIHNLSSTGDFVVQDGGTTFLTLSDSSVTTWILPTAGNVVLDASSTATTTTAGVLDVNVTAGNAAVDGMNIDLAVNDGATAGTDFESIVTTLTANDADADVFGLVINAVATANAAAGSYEALIKLDNAENSTSSVTDAILVQATTNDSIVDGIDVSDAEITNALNIGSNFITGGQVSLFSPSTGVWTVEDTSTNDLVTITDLGATGSLTVTGLTTTGGVIFASSGLLAQDSDITFATDTLTVTKIALTTTATLSENASIALDPAGSADGKYSGTTVTGTGGATIAFGDLVTLDKDDSRWELVTISVAAAATGDARGIIGIAVTSSTDGGAITVLLNGIIRADANFPALTIGASVYASTTGDIVVTQPTTVDYVIRIVGFALTADEIYFNPSNDYITHT